MKKFSELVADIPFLNSLDLPSDPFISGIAGAFQDCTQGGIFVADVSETTDRDQISEHLDGADYLDHAVKTGVSVIITRPDVIKPKCDYDLIFIQHPEPLTFLGSLAAAFYDHAAPEYVGAVTGTDGKTSTVNFSAQLFALIGKKSIAVGNMGLRVSGRQFIGHLPPNLSVPETVDFQRMLSEYRADSYEAVFTEATSHALHDYRLNGSPLFAAAITNLTHDHLDFHGTMENYVAAKMRLFGGVLPEGHAAILNTDMDYYDEFRAVCEARNHKIIGYGKAAKDLKLLGSKHVDKGLDIRFKWQGREHTVTAPLIGHFQAYNILCALGFMEAAGFKAEDVVPLVAQIESVPGRMEYIGTSQTGGRIYVDYAHTPDGMQQALKSIREAAYKSVTVVFGCDGRRDKEKRPIMGRIAEELADTVILTHSFPRDEDPDDITRDTLAGMNKPENVQYIRERAAAIEHAITATEPGDIVLIVGAPTSDPWINTMANDEQTTDSKLVTEILTRRRH